MRTLLDVIPLDSTLVKGSHGLPARTREESPIFATNAADLVTSGLIEATDVCELILRHL
jgi:hypothetical protein